MKKIIFLSMMAVMVFACKSKSTATTTDTQLSTKLDRPSQVAIKGNWVITNVIFTGSDYIIVNSFDIADSKCFIGSTWKFISNNNKGSMTLTSSNCPAFSSPIVWSINKEGLFILKIVESGTKSKNIKEGYVLKVAGLTENSFQLVDNVNIGGQTKDVIYQFSRAN